MWQTGQVARREMNMYTRQGKTKTIVASTSSGSAGMLSVASKMGNTTMLAIGTNRNSVKKAAMIVVNRWVHLTGLCIITECFLSALMGSGLRECRRKPVVGMPLRGFVMVISARVSVWIFCFVIFP